MLTDGEKDKEKPSLSSHLARHSTDLGIIGSSGSSSSSNSSSSGSSNINNNNGISNITFPCLQQWNIWLILNIDEKVNGTRILVLFLIIGFLLNLNEKIHNILIATVSSIFIDTQILKMLSSLFVNDGLFWGISYILSCSFIASSIEYRRGTYYLIAFIFFVGLSGQILTLIIFVSYYYFSFDTYYLETPICGFSAIMSGFSVAIAVDSEWRRQLIFNFRTSKTSSSSISSSGSGTIVSNDLSNNLNQWSLTCQYLPFIVVCLHILLFSFGLILIQDICLGICGVYCAWLYLRFFAISETGEKGNRDEAFAAHMLCPWILRFPVLVLANCAFSITEQLGLCQQDNQRGGKSDMGEHSRIRMETNSRNIDLELQPDTSLYENLDPSQAHQRKEAKKLIESRLAELKKEIDSRALDQITPK